MRVKLQMPFQMLTLFMTALMFNMPSVIRAQQNPVQAEAIAPAEQDAINDVNKLIWFGAGVAVPVVGLAGALAGYLVGSRINPQTDDFFGVPTSNTQMAGGAAVGLAVGVSGPLFWIRGYEPNLPAKRFIGKSPEYIEWYTDAYHKKAKSLRTKSAIGGSAVGCIGMIAFVLLAIE